MNAWAALALLLTILLVGSWLAAVLDRIVAARAAGRTIARPLSAPITSAARWLLQQSISTEHPDRINRLLAPALYLSLAVIGIAPLPLYVDHALLELPTGIVLWGTVEAVTVVAVFLQGWSANSPLPLIGAYRYVAIGMPIMLVSMFVLIAAALPAQSLSFTAIVESQREVWNLLRQPLGLPLFLLVGLSLTLRGPLDYADSADLAGGASAETSGAARAMWQLARLMMLVSFAAVASTVFLGGPLGPWLAGPWWLALKTLLLMLLLITVGQRLARLPVERMMTLIWTVLTPLAFVDLLIAGFGALR